MRYIVHVNGGGIRKTRHETLPAAWAAVLTTVDAQGTRAFSQYVCGTVRTNPDIKKFENKSLKTSKQISFEYVWCTLTRQDLFGPS